MKAQTTASRILGLAVACGLTGPILADENPPTPPGGVSPAPALNLLEVPAETGSMPTGPSAEPPRSWPIRTIQVSPWLNEVIKLAQAGIEEGVMLSYVEGTPGTFNLGSDQIIFIRDLGVPNPVINAILRHDAEITSGRRRVPASGVPASDLPLLPGLPSAVASIPPGAQPQASAVQTPAAASAPSALERSEVDDVFVEIPALPFLLDQAAQREWAARMAYSPRVSNTRRPYPVREPYPVQLTSPILVVNAGGRVPNLQVIQLFP